MMMVKLGCKHTPLLAGIFSREASSFLASLASTPSSSHAQLTFIRLGTNNNRILYKYQDWTHPT